MYLLHKICPGCCVYVKYYDCLWDVLCLLSGYCLSLESWVTSPYVYLIFYLFFSKNDKQKNNYYYQKIVFIWNLIYGQYSFGRINILLINCRKTSYKW